MNAADIENRVLELNKKQESEETAKAGFWEEFEVCDGTSRVKGVGSQADPVPLLPSLTLVCPTTSIPVETPLLGLGLHFRDSSHRVCRSRR